MFKQLKHKSLFQFFQMYKINIEEYVISLFRPTNFRNVEMLS